MSFLSHSFACLGLIFRATSVEDREQHLDEESSHGQLVDYMDHDRQHNRLHAPDEIGAEEIVERHLWQRIETMEAIVDEGNVDE